MKLLQSQCLPGRFMCHSLFIVILIFYGLCSIAIAQPSIAQPPNTTVTPWEREIHALTQQLAENETASSESLNAVPLLIQRGEVWRQVGDLKKAAADFQMALSKARKETPPMPLLEIAAMQSLGYVYLLQNDLKAADPLLHDAYERSKPYAQRAPVLAASCANRWGNLLAKTHRPSDALTLYNDGLTVLQSKNPASIPNPIRQKTPEDGVVIVKSKDPALEAALHRNIAHVLTDNQTAFTHLSEALALTKAIPSIHERTSLLLDIATEAENRDPTPAGDAFRYHALKRATILAESTTDQTVAATETINGEAESAAATGSPQLESEGAPSNFQQSFPFRPHRLLSLCYGKMGALYQSRQRINEAITLTEQAITEAGAIQNHALLQMWEWQLGRLLKVKNEIPKAIAAYERTLFHVDTLRQDGVANNGDPNCPPSKSDPFTIYTELADLLLNQSGKTSDKTAQQALLKSARASIERGKQSELRDYFKDPCIRSKTKTIKAMAKGTAVIYPLVLPDRLEILVEIEGRLQRHTVAVTKSETEQTLTQLVSNIRNNLFHKSLSQTVYNWLILPISSQLESQNVDTLIFVPDGVFRMLPLAALWSGDAYLTERYAVVTEPSLTLFDPRPLPRSGMTALIAGMSEPGPVVMALPDLLWNALTQIDPNEKNRWIRGITIKSAPQNTAIPKTDARSLRMAIAKEETVKDESSKEASIKPQSKEAQAAQVREILKLPGVDKEMKNITQTLNGDMMLNTQFLLSNFSDNLEQKDYGVIHIASHGFFGGSSEENFIMTYDKILDMEHMESFIRPKQFASQPVELITLSACQTAEGNDRSPLGLAGVALRSGARSVMGSLWPVSDSATQILLSQFYKQLQSEKITKAQALQLAQKKLIENSAYDHPFHWAAFILIGNWL